MTRRRWAAWLLLFACSLAAVSCVRPSAAVKLPGTEPLAPKAAAVAEGNVGFRKITLSYKATDGPRNRSVLLWYPTGAEAGRHDYHGQIGFVAPDAVVLEGRHPLVLFSHGFLGIAEQSLFLVEALARRGYVVAAVNHADASTPQRGAKPVAWPNFGDPKTWDETRYRDRKEDLAALLDHLLAENGRDGSFLHGRIDEGAIGAAGHSLGGYTVLGVVGGWESWRDDRVRAALLLSPYVTPFTAKGTVSAVKAPVMLQGGTMDWGITPFLPEVYDKLRGPRYYLVLKGENHFGWTNLASAGKTTVECVQEGNPELMTDYGIAFFDRHLRGAPDAELLGRKNPRLESYQHKVK